MKGGPPQYVRRRGCRLARSRSITTTKRTKPQKQRSNQRGSTTGAWGAAAGPCPGRRASAGDRLGDAVNAGEDGVVDPVLAHQGSDAPADDVVRLEVGEVTAHALAGLDPDAALAGGDDQHYSVVLALLSGAPGLDDLVAHVLDGLALQRGRDQHEDLVGGLPLVVPEPVVEVRELPWAEEPRGVGDVVGLLRDVEGPRSTGDEEEQGRAERAPGPPRHQNVTLGACWASDEAWK